MSSIPWNKRRAFPNYEVAIRQGFLKKYSNRLIQCLFGMILREGYWDDKMLSTVGFYSQQEIDLHELS